jgi:hypothetical protein
MKKILRAESKESEILSTVRTFTQKFDRLLFRYNHVTHFFLNFYTIHGVSHLFPFSKTFIFQQAFIF